VSVTDISVDLFKKPCQEYSDDQKQFAATLFFYSPKAYNYLREKLTLPHPVTIRRWLMAMLEIRDGPCVRGRHFWIWTYICLKLPARWSSWNATYSTFRTVNKTVKIIRNNNLFNEQTQIFFSFKWRRKWTWVSSCVRGSG